MNRREKTYLHRNSIWSSKGSSCFPQKQHYSMRLCSQWHLPPNLKSNGSIILMLIVTRSGKVEQINLKEIIKSENHDIYWSTQLIPAKTAQYKMWNNNHLAFSNYRIKLIQGTGTILARIIGLILSDAKHLICGKIQLSSRYHGSY